MTKTFAQIAARLNAKSGEPGMMRQAPWQTDSLFEILNLSHWDLFGIWFLVLGILPIWFA